MTAEEISQILDELGERLGPAGSRLFELAIRQVYIDGFLSLALTLATIAAWVIALPKVYRWAMDEVGEYGMNDRGFVAVIGGFLAFVVTVGVAAMALSSIPAMLNPEYAAIRKLLSHMP